MVAAEIDAVLPFCLTTADLVEINSLTADRSEWAGRSRRVRRCLIRRVVYGACMTGSLGLDKREGNVGTQRRLAIRRKFQMSVRRDRRPERRRNSLVSAIYCGGSGECWCHVTVSGVGPGYFAACNSQEHGASVLWHLRAGGKARNGWEHRGLGCCWHNLQNTTPPGIQNAGVRTRGRDEERVRIGAARRPVAELGKERPESWAESETDRQDRTAFGSVPDGA